MKFFAPLAITAALAAAPLAAQEVVPIDPVTGIQGFGALGATTTLTIIAGVITIAVLIADDDGSSSGTTD